MDSIAWVRDDSIIVGCVRLTEDGDEYGYLIQVITDRGGKFTEVCVLHARVFYDCFAKADSESLYIMFILGAFYI